MYRLKIEFKSSEVKYYKILNFSDVIKLIDENPEAIKINIWYKEQKVKEK